MTLPATAIDVATAEAALIHWLGAWDRVLVAFSAGVDSTYLLAVAVEQLGSRVIAVTADSPSLARSSLQEAKDFCGNNGITHRIVATDEFSHDAYVQNQGQRCYECKAALFRAMHGLAVATAPDRDERCALVLGAVVDDFDDVRPGLRAAAEAGARWPLVEAGFTKELVRNASRQRNLSTWNRPAEPCLSSRFPYGEAVTRSGLAMIEAAEVVLHNAGFPECRARHHRIGDDRGSLCRIEVPETELPRLVALRDQVLPAIRALGYAQVTVDLAGLQSGGFNALLRADERLAAIPAAFPNTKAD